MGTDIDHQGRSPHAAFKGKKADDFHWITSF
jgi:hypothetical protein